MAFLLLFTITCYGQKWVEYQVDSTLTVTLPENFQTKDTLGQYFVNVRIDYGLMMIQRIAPQSDKLIIRTKGELVKRYEVFQNGMIESQRGELVAQNYEVSNGLQLTRFSYRTKGKEDQIRHCLGALIKGRWYAIQFWEVEAHAAELKADRERFFSSVKFSPDLRPEDQMTADSSLAYKVGYFLGRNLTLIAIIALIVAALVWIGRKLVR